MAIKSADPAIEPRVDLRDLLRKKCHFLFGARRNRQMTDNENLVLDFFESDRTLFRQAFLDVIQNRKQLCAQLGQKGIGERAKLASQATFVYRFDLVD